MTDLPYMRFYVSDYEGHTAHLTLVEDGAYSRLLRLCWRTPGCSIPADRAWIVRHMRVDEDTYDRVVAPIIQEFFKIERGRVFQKRQRKEQRKATATRPRRIEAGRAGGLAKARKTAKKQPSKRVANSTYLEPEPDPDNSDTNVSAAAVAAAGDNVVFIDPVKVMFDEGGRILRGVGKSKEWANGLLGRWWQKEGYSPEEVIAALTKAEHDKVPGKLIIPFVTRSLQDGRLLDRAAVSGLGPTELAAKQFVSDFYASLGPPNGGGICDDPPAGALADRRRDHGPGGPK